jgi:hypothetical protein
LLDFLLVLLSNRETENHGLDLKVVRFFTWYHQYILLVLFSNRETKENLAYQDQLDPEVSMVFLVFLENTENLDPLDFKDSEEKRDWLD